jgi:hypothetical protein
MAENRGAGKPVLIGVNFALEAACLPVILSAAKNLSSSVEILRCAQNDRLDGCSGCEVDAYGLVPALATGNTSHIKSYVYRCLASQIRL